MYSVVAQLWPRSRLSADEFSVGAWQRLRSYGVDVIISALKRHRQMDLDAIRPKWSSLFKDLAGTGDEGGDRKGDFQILLDHLRRHLREQRAQGCENWGDAEVFQNHLDANPSRVAGIRRGWVEYFQDRGETPPGFLIEG